MVVAAHVFGVSSDVFYNATASTIQHSFVVCWHESFIYKTAKPTAKLACEPTKMCLILDSS